MSLAVVQSFKAISKVLNHLSEDYYIFGELQKRSDKVTVQLIFKKHEIDWQCSSFNGLKSHDVTLNLLLTVSEPAIADIKGLASEDPLTRAVAVSNLTTPSYNAQEKILEVWSYLYRIINSADFNNYLVELGAEFDIKKNTIKNRALQGLECEEINKSGGLGLIRSTSEYNYVVKDTEQTGAPVYKPEITIVDTKIDESAGVRSELVNQ